jgi:hypothetical protein
VPKYFTACLSSSDRSEIIGREREKEMAPARQCRKCVPGPGRRRRTTRKGGENFGVFWRAQAEKAAAGVVHIKNK